MTPLDAITVYLVIGFIVGIFVVIRQETFQTPVGALCFLVFINMLLWPIFVYVYIRTAVEGE